MSNPVSLVIPADVYERMLQAFVSRNETLSRNYIAVDWNQFNTANARIAEVLWPLVSATQTQT